MSSSTNKSFNRRGCILAITTILLTAGCSEQPIGYIFQPTRGDQVNLARTTVDIVSILYNFTDAATGYLDAAALTTDYHTIFPGGWSDTSVYDSLSNSQVRLYYRNYLDQNYNF